MVDRSRIEETVENEAEPQQERGDASEEWKDRYLRLAADLENRKTALERAYALRAQHAWEALLRDLLPLADNLERALHNVPPAERETSLYSGVELTLRDFLKALAQHGVEQMDVLGEPFDPERHEAVAVVPHPTMPPETVVRVDLPGYLLDGRLLRPARVLVTSG